MMRVVIVDPLAFGPGRQICLLPSGTTCADQGGSLSRLEALKAFFGMTMPERAPMQNTCRKAGPFFWLGLVATIVISCALYVAASIYGGVISESVHVQHKHNVRTRVMQAMAMAVVSWKVQHGQLPDAGDGKALLEGVRRFPDARPLSEKTVDVEFERILRGTMELSYAAEGDDRFSLTASGPDGFAVKTMHFKSDGTPASAPKGASDE